MEAVALRVPVVKAPPLPGASKNRPTTNPQGVRDFGHGMKFEQRIWTPINELDRIGIQGHTIDEQERSLTFAGDGSDGAYELAILTTWSERRGGDAVASVTRRVAPPRRWTFGAPKATRCTSSTGL